MEMSIDSAVKTVAHLAVYFDELEIEALTVKATGDARGRGYFTPAEDDEVRHLLVSYWQSRNALHEVILGMVGDDPRPERIEGAAFLCAYAAALLLVDAARSMRENFGDSSMVRRKLNEEQPGFGVPAAVYDTVQKSLTDPENAWKLHSALSWFDENESRLRSMAAEDDRLDPVMAVIDKLGHRVRVRVRDLAVARMKERAREAGNKLHRDGIRSGIYRLQRAISRMVSKISVNPEHVAGLPAEVEGELLRLLRPGDILVTRKEFAASNYFLPGYWPHAALYLGTAAELESLGLHEHENFTRHWSRIAQIDVEQPSRVLEALADGVSLRSVRSPLGCDAIAAIRPTLATADIARAIGRGMQHEGKSYDFDFDFTRSDRMVCTEVIYRSFQGISGVEFTLARRAGRLTLAAEDLLSMALAGNSLVPLAAYCGDRVDSLQTGDAAAQLLRQSLGL